MIETLNAAVSRLTAQELQIKRLTCALRFAREYIQDNLTITIGEAGYGESRGNLAEELDVIDGLETLLMAIDAALAVPQ